MNTNMSDKGSSAQVKYAEFPCLPKDSVNKEGKPILNRWSTFVTKEHDHPAAQVRQKSFFPHAIHPLTFL
jgi:dihydroxy-acid dehydratase